MEIIPNTKNIIKLKNDSLNNLSFFENNHAVIAAIVINKNKKSKRMKTIPLY